MIQIVQHAIQEDTLKAINVYLVQVNVWSVKALVNVLYVILDIGLIIPLVLNAMINAPLAHLKLHAHLALMATTLTELHAKLVQLDVLSATVLLNVLLANQIIIWMVLVNNVLLDHSYQEMVALIATAFVPPVKLQPPIVYPAYPNTS